MNLAMPTIVSRLKSAQIALSEFPWRLATAFYTLSWGWSLLRPNTLYWDDWAYIHNKPKGYLNQIFVDTGLPPWRALIDQELIAIGYWTIPVLTFTLFFASGISLFLILRGVNFELSKSRIIVLIFLIAPVNHARIALVMFGYTTSYFLFFSAWAILVKHSRQRYFLLALVLFFWSFMTHSFLFFYLLPVAHFSYLKRKNLNGIGLSKILNLKIILLTVIPFLYYTLRKFFWYPIKQFDGYHRWTVAGTMRGLIFLLIGVIIIFLFIYSFSALKTNLKTGLSATIGWGVLAWGLFPYFVNQNIPNLVSPFALRTDYASRHLLLTPLGISFLLGILLTTLTKVPKKLITTTLFSIFVGANFFFGAQFFLESFKKEELIELFRDSEVVNENVNLILTDDTKIFNGRFSIIRNTEVIELVALADKDVKSISVKATCKDVNSGFEIRLKSNQSFFRALFSRNLGLYFEISEC